MASQNYKVMLAEPPVIERPGSISKLLLARFFKQGRRHWPFLLILLAFLGLATSYSQTVPAWETPDEPAHFAYVRQIRLHGGPPIQSFKEGANEVETGHHPPLYYYLAALVSLPHDLGDWSRARTNPYFSFSNQDGGPNRFQHEDAAQLYPQTLAAVGAMRLLSTLFGAGTLGCIYLSGLLIFGGRGWEWASGGRLPATLAAGLAGLLPQFAFLSGAVNNDNAVIFFCALSLWLCLRLALHPPPAEAHGPERDFGWPTFVGLGLAVGLGLLSKYNEAVYIPLVGLALAWGGWQRRSLAFFVRGALFSGATCLAVAGWWFGRAWWLYGDPMGWEMWRSSYRSIDQSSSFQLSGQFVAHVWERWFNSFWGYFGWFNLPLEEPVYKWLGRFSAWAALGLAGLVLTGLAGRLGLFRAAPGWRYDRRMALGLGLAGLSVGLVAATAFSYATTFGDAGTQGRYLFPALPGLALLGGAGVGWWVGLVRLWSPEVSRAARPVLAAWLGWAVGLAGAIALLWLNLYALNDVIRPAYASDTTLRAQYVVPDLPRAAVRLSQPNRFEPGLELVGYRFGPARRADIRSNSNLLKVTLYWRLTTKKPLAQNWIDFVHLTSGDQKLGQSDGPPGQGRFQTFKWRPGELVQDERTFRLNDWQMAQAGQADAPLELYIGWLRAGDGSRARLDDGSEGLTLTWT